MFSRIRAVHVVICLVAFAGTAAAQRRSITEKDLFQFNWIGDPQISPDGSQVAFVKISVNEKKTGYDTSIWTVSTHGDEAPRRLTNGLHDSSPRWSPDGKLLVFVRSPEPPATAPAAGAAGAAGAGARPESPQLYMLNLGGGESWKLTSLPRGASSPVWSPDSKWITFNSTTNPDDLAKARKGKPDQKPESQESPSREQNAPEKPQSESAKAGDDADHESDVRVITRAVYRMNEAGYLDPKHPEHIWVIAAPQSSEENVTPKQLTTGKYSEQNLIWSKDGRQIYFTTSRVDEPYYELPHSDLYSVAATGGEIQKILSFDFAPQELALSPDGTQLAFCASLNKPVQSYTEPHLWVVDLKSGAQPRNLTTKFDYDVCSGVGGDQAPPRAGGPQNVVWARDGKSIVAATAVQGKAKLARVDVASQRVTDVTTGNQAVERYRASSDGSKLVMLISTPTSIGDLFIQDAAGGQPRQLTHINDKLFSQLNLTMPEEMWYTSFDGKKVHAWIQKPPDFDPAKKYPLILNIHGGPHSAYGWIFDHEFQWMAAKGYVVLYPNPRGSTSYGQEFGNIIQYHYPGDDFRDLMLGVDEVIKRGYIDTRRLGVTGGSGGGLLTNWVVGHTDRFSAAVAQRDIASWTAWWYSADFTLFQPSWFKAPPFQDTQDFVQRSPLTYIQNVKTPMMFILGEADYRTPPESGGEEMFRALKFLRRPTIMIRFPGESHELSRSGQPWHRVERLEHIVGWFDKYLQGMRKPEYDDVTAQEVPLKAEQLPGKQNLSQASPQTQPERPR
jgi:dipeptidyl aminopeptidase/acylaminoacyl peptidase